MHRLECPAPSLTLFHFMVNFLSWKAKPFYLHLTGNSPPPPPPFLFTAYHNIFLKCQRCLQFFQSNRKRSTTSKSHHLLVIEALLLSLNSCSCTLHVLGKSSEPIINLKQWEHEYKKDHCRSQYDHVFNPGDLHGPHGSLCSPPPLPLNSYSVICPY